MKKAIIVAVSVFLVCLLSTHVRTLLPGSSKIFQPVVVSVNSSIAAQCPFCDTERKTNFTAEEEWYSSFLYQIEEIVANKSGMFIIIIMFMT